MTKIEDNRDRGASKVELLLSTAKLILRNWLLIAIICVSGTVLGAIYILALPRSYTAKVSMLLETNSPNAAAGGLSSLASMAGVKLGSAASDDAIYPQVYPDIISTPSFLNSLLSEKVMMKDSKDYVTLLDFLTKHQKSPWWENLFPKKEKSKPFGKINPYRLTKKQNELFKSLSSGIICMIDKKSDVITVQVTLQDPEVAAQIAEKIKQKLQVYITNYRTNKARNDLAYATKITKETKSEYLKAQRKYADFCDANQDLVLTIYQQEAERLENEMQLAYNAYSQSMQQMQLAQAKVQERTPVFTTVEPVTVPIKPSAPKRMIFLFAVMMVLFLGSSLWVIWRDSYHKHKASKSMEFDEIIYEEQKPNA